MLNFLFQQAYWCPFAFTATGVQVIFIKFLKCTPP